MLNIPELLAQELSLKPFQVSNALELLAEGATVPFIARYRKERTGEMTETQLRELFDRHAYLTELEERKQTILQAIAQQGKLTPELQAEIERCLQKNELEDLYLPYRPKRRTRATIAREKGLEPLAEWIKALNTPQASAQSLETEAAKYVSAEKGVATAQEALKGASDILAEAVADTAEYRAYLRDYLLDTGELVSQVKADYPEGSTKFEMYRNYRAKVKTIPSHNLLALYRGEAEGILTLELEFSEDAVLGYLSDQVVRAKVPAVRQFYQAMLMDAFNRLMRTSLIGEVRSLKKQEADEESIRTFEANLRELLLAPPAGMKPTLAIDPGFRTGCKVAVLDQTGQFLEYKTIFPHQSANQREDAARSLSQMIQKYGVELIAIGNGTAGRETDEFVDAVLATLDRKPIKVMVNEAGASVYSASPVAIAEFPDQDVTVRGAISIGRRLQDPLAELVKIDPKSIGVGQYQHDVDQKRLKQKLDETVESCVNYVGVDLNTASKELLTFVSGVTPTIASNIVAYRNQNGAFRNRRELMKVAKLGPKAFEQAAGFLRIRNGENPLDNTAVHPESYSVVSAIAADLQLPLTQITQIANQIQSINLKKYVTEAIGEPTLRDIVSELEKPGRDPRAEFKYATFKEGVKEISDLSVGMELEGVVTNVANFGAFVDIGVHQDGLVHVSQLADRFVSDPKQVVKVGQVVKVRVLEVNEALKRISLSMRSDAVPTNQARKPKEKQATTKQQSAAKQSPAASLEDLKAKFGKRL
ncbi:MAG TPA: RNA-binding transcriptional accessory protein [Leptolyngbyaceae cyanobacterium M33_DOE_097]|uniref:RNA-binding transcriptional accessory protein n=1 Tax=Oscillatoriales cyanobacterium SpSt-418 TaxID=2282169 RepID=A0A7C3KCQ8_9CYAN|nr:RNA-binding transcriptional accessory protein [Leptolyngbyaceae cyanobacterium M33_DOE_097]